MSPRSRVGGAGSPGRVGVRASPLLLTLLLAGCASSPSGAAAGEYRGVSARLPTGSPAISAAGLVAAYDMETPTDRGRLRDFGPHGLHGVVRRQVRIDGPFGRALRFRTVEDRVDLPEAGPFDLDGPLTLAARVRVDELGLHQHVAACDDKWALWVTPDDQFRLGDTRGGGWSSPPGSVEAGRWTAVVAVLRGTRGDPLTEETVTLYLDGEAAGTAHWRTDGARDARAWSPGELHADDACYLGFESHQGEERHQRMPFVGALDELLVFSRAWSPEEVRVFSTSASR